MAYSGIICVAMLVSALASPLPNIIPNENCQSHTQEGDYTDSDSESVDLVSISDDDEAPRPSAERQMSDAKADSNGLFGIYNSIREEMWNFIGDQQPIADVAERNPVEDKCGSNEIVSDATLVDLLQLSNPLAAS